MICGVCKLNESKYKCPNCEILYCSLACYKSHDHKVETPKEVFKLNTELIDSKYKSLIDDKELQYLLSFKSLRHHLFEIYKITNDYVSINKRNQLMNTKLNDLRKFGIEENELVEEFCQRVIKLLNS